MTAGADATPTTADVTAPVSGSTRRAGWARRLWWLALILVAAAVVYLVVRLSGGLDAATVREVLVPSILAVAGGSSAILASFLGRLDARSRLSETEADARRLRDEARQLEGSRQRQELEARRLAEEVDDLARERERIASQAQQVQAERDRLEHALVETGRALNTARADHAAFAAAARSEADALRADLTAQAAELQGVREEAEQARERFTSEIQARDAAVAERDVALRERDGRLEQARVDLEHRDGRIVDLERTVREREAALADEQAAHEESRTQLEAAITDTRRELEERERTSRRERERLERRDHDREQWVDRLRSEVHRLHQERGVLPDGSDLPALILRTAVTLLEAEKGILLSRTDADHDGDLELLAAVGFESDPERSLVAQRFAGRVIERDRIVREDDPTAPDTGDSATPADREIRNLVAIPVYVLDEFRGVVIAANREGGFEALDEEVLVALGGQAGALMQNARLQDRLRRSYVATVRVLADAMEAKDGSLRGHGNDVARYASAVAARLGLDARQQQEVAFGSLLHDIGKIGVSELILLKPGPLTAEEASVVRLHPRIGFRLVEQVPELGSLARGILYHHERFDGRGYPSGLKGEEIPREARIITVSDAFSAMTSDRPYRPRMPTEYACDELRRHAGTQFDPEIVSVFVDEVLSQPPSDVLSTLGLALQDPEVLGRRAGEESLLGHTEFTLTDSVTLLYSHRYLNEVLAAHVQRAALQETPCAVVLVELTGIADLNLRHGYVAGDKALRAAARSLQTLAARVNGVACRESGRRLAIVIPYGDEAVATAIARELVLELMDGVGARAGVGVWRSGDRAEDLLERARLGLGSLRRTV